MAKEHTAAYPYCDVTGSVAIFIRMKRGWIFGELRLFFSVTIWLSKKEENVGIRIFNLLSENLTLSYPVT